MGQFYSLIDRCPTFLWCFGCLEPKNEQSNSQQAAIWKQNKTDYLSLLFVWISYFYVAVMKYDVKQWDKVYFSLLCQRERVHKGREGMAQKQQREVGWSHRKEKEEGFLNLKRPYLSDVLLARLYLLNDPYPPQTVPPTGTQVFNYRSLWGTFSFKPSGASGIGPSPLILDLVSLGTERGADLPAASGIQVQDLPWTHICPAWPSPSYLPVWVHVFVFT